MEFNLSPSFSASEQTLFRGVNVEGGLPESRFSDDQRAKYNPGFVLNDVEAPVWLIYDADVFAGFDYELTVEAQAGTPGLERVVEQFNYTTSSYDVVGAEPESFNIDSISTNALLPNNFGPNQEVRARVGWYQTGFTLNFPWEIRVDQVAWNQLQP